MRKYFLLCLFLTVALAQSYCPSGRVLIGFTCSSVSVSQGCSGFFQFSPAVSTAAYPDIPRICKNPTSGSKCVTGTTTCIPPCTLGGPGPAWKTGGPNGKICTGLLTQADCYQYYADNSGDRWCFWSTTLNTCMEGILCHD